ncbi:hypothetical protein [Alkalibaculum bacchi]|nr:hypothetical protein [Alkalibaculum bacchi]
MIKILHIANTIRSFLQEKINSVFDPNFDLWNDYVLEDEFRFITKVK